MMRTPRVLLLAPLLWLCGIAGAEDAQTAAAPAPPPAAPPGAALQPIKLGSLTLSGTFRSRFEAWDWFEGNASNQYGFSGNMLRLSLSQTTEHMDWQFELAVPFLLSLPKDAIAPAPQGQFGLGGAYFAANSNRTNAAMAFPKQGFLRFKGLFGDSHQNLRVGRFEFIDGAEATPKDATLAAFKRDRINQRLIGPFGFSTVNRSFDGLHYTLVRKNVTYTLLGALATRGSFQVDGWGELKTGFVYGSVVGQMVHGHDAGEWRVLAIYYQDWRHILKTDNRPAPVRLGDLTNIRIGTYGGHYLHKHETAVGALNFAAWGVLQNGRWGRQQQASGALDLEAGWQPRLGKLRPWLGGGYFHSSGDDNPSDNKHNTFFQLLPTPRPFARFPFYNLINSDDRFANLTLRPHKVVTLRSEFHALRLANPHDLWYSGGGAFQPQTFGYNGRNTSGARGLANQWDASLDWNANAHVNLNAFIGYAQGKAAIRAIYPRDSSGMLWYLELNYKF